MQTFQQWLIEEGFWGDLKLRFGEAKKILDDISREADKGLEAVLEYLKAQYPDVWDRLTSFANNPKVVEKFEQGAAPGAPKPAQEGIEGLEGLQGASPAGDATLSAIRTIGNVLYSSANLAVYLLPAVVALYLAYRFRKQLGDIARIVAKKSQETLKTAAQAVGLMDSDALRKSKEDFKARQAAAAKKKADEEAKAEAAKRRMLDFSKKVAPPKGRLPGSPPTSVKTPPPPPPAKRPPSDF